MLGAAKSIAVEKASSRTMPEKIGITSRFETTLMKVILKKKYAESGIKTIHTTEETTIESKKSVVISDLQFILTEQNKSDSDTAAIKKMIV